jgi:hypothetical protein
LDASASIKEIEDRRAWISQQAAFIFTDSWLFQTIVCAKRDGKIPKCPVLIQTTPLDSSKRLYIFPRLNKDYFRRITIHESPL